MMHAKCEYCGRYGPLGSCEGCGAPNQPDAIDRVEVTGLGDSEPRYILSHAGKLSKAQQDEIRRQWETNFSGPNAGKVVVLGGGPTWHVEHNKNI